MVICNAVFLRPSLEMKLSYIGSMRNNIYNMKTKMSVIKELNNGSSIKELTGKYDISYFLVRSRFTRNILMIGLNIPPKIKSTGFILTNIHH